MKKFITFEGGEASGKSTQAQLLYKTLVESGKKVVLTREPGGTKEAELLRKLLLDAENNWDYKSEILLYLAARNEHLQNVILPKLADDYFVICDRFLDSTIAYQAYGRGGDIGFIQQVYQLIAGGFKPNLTFILDSNPELTQERLHKRGNKLDSYELEDKAFHERVREGFRNIASSDPDRCVLLDATLSQELLHQQIIGVVQELIL